jgi:hypothetical protein
MRTFLIVALVCGMSVGCVQRYLVKRADLEAAYTAPRDDKDAQIIVARRGQYEVRLRTWRLDDGFEPGDEPGDVWVQTRDASTPLLATGYTLMAGALIAMLIGVEQENRPCHSDACRWDGFTGTMTLISGGVVAAIPVIVGHSLPSAEVGWPLATPPPRWGIVPDATYPQRLEEP